MGRPKLLLPWGDTTVLGHLLAQWKAVRVAQIGVVCSGDIPDFTRELDRLEFPESNRILNPHPERGMFSSIQVASAWTDWRKDITHWIVTLGDQPHLRSDTFRHLLDFGAGHPERICQPMRSGHRRHPVLMPKRVFAAVKDSSAPNLQAFLHERTGDRAGFELDDPGLELDMDTPEEYEEARRLWTLHAESAGQTQT
jgi:molybdenum cofactor cytidylyltransferase